MTVNALGGRGNLLLDLRAIRIAGLVNNAAATVLAASRCRDQDRHLHGPDLSTDREKQTVPVRSTAFRRPAAVRKCRSPQVSSKPPLGNGSPDSGWRRWDLPLPGQI